MVSVSVKLGAIVTLVLSTVLASTIPGIDSIQVQLAARATNLMDSVYNDLSDQETDFINDHITNLTSFNGTKCEQCKNKMRYGRALIDQYPQQQHLVSLLLFKYCVFQNNNTETKCDNNDFFVTTKTKNTNHFNDDVEGGVTSATSIDFYDNDFLEVLKNFNISSDNDLTYYCYFKASACTLPPLPDVNKVYGVDSWWPAKQTQHYSEPIYNKTQSQRAKFNVLHITDFHIQLRYTVGAESNCSVTPCALPESVNPDLPNVKNYNFTDYYKVLDPATKNYQYSFYPDAHYDANDTYIPGDYYDYPKHRGYAFKSAPATTFGGYLTDSPEILMNNSLKYISQAHSDKNFTFSIFTGDLVDHDVYHCDANTTYTAETKSARILKHYLKNIPVYTSLGNHDTFPYGQLSPIKFNSNNSYNENDQLMSELIVGNGWLPEDKRNQIKTHYSGFSYVNDQGLKIISLNSNCYYQKNLWSYINLSTDPDLFGQWQFLVQELVASEKIGQRVWILAHIPVTDGDALPIQAAIFGKIVERFSPYTIANIFYGHTHRDQFHVVYKNNTKQASDIVNMAWVSQSITPLPNYNPSWRYYQVEEESFNIYNCYNYYTKLNNTFINGGAEPNWDYEYSSRDLYDSNQTWPLTSPLNGTFWHNQVVTKLSDKSNVNFHQLYSNLQYRYGPQVPKCNNNSVVSKTCWNENYCIVSNFLSSDYNACLIS